MAKLIILRGPSGFGKSTWAKRYIAESPYNWTHLEADMYFINDDGVYEFKAENLRWAHKWCLDTAKIMLKTNQNVIVSNTSTRIKEFKDYYDFAIKNGFPVEVKRLYVNFGNVHGVPADKVQAMIDRMEDFEGEQDATNYWDTLTKGAVNTNPKWGDGVVRSIGKDPCGV